MYTGSSCKGGGAQVHANSESGGVQVEPGSSEHLDNAFCRAPVPALGTHGSVVFSLQLRYVVIENLIFIRAHGHLLHFKFQITI